MIKDIHQKVKAVRYCVALGMVPYLEVVVRFSGDTGARPTDVTDIDVLGVQPAGMNEEKKILFDCKSGQKMSAINRALWAGGLCQLTGADEVFVILGREAPDGHRLAGNTIGVRLFSEALFDAYASAATKDYVVGASYLEEVAAWDKLLELKKSYPNLRDFIEFLTSEAPLEKNGVAGLRALLSKIKRVEGELDPSKPAHRALFLIAVSQALVFLSDMARDYHNIFDPKGSLEAFEQGLRYYVWGGKEAYDLRQRLNAALKVARGVETAPPFEFPAWSVFIEFFRTLLDAPFAAASSCLALKDLGFREIADVKPEVDLRLKQRLLLNNRIRQYANAAAAYLVEASRLPRDFKLSLQSAFSNVAD